MKTLGIIALIMLMGCGDKTERHAKAVKRVDDIIYKNINMVTLEDGTRCVVYRGNNGAGGIDCNWAENGRDLPRDLPQ